MTEMNKKINGYNKQKVKKKWLKWTESFKKWLKWTKSLKMAEMTQKKMTEYWGFSDIFFNCNFLYSSRQCVEQCSEP